MKKLSNKDRLRIKLHNLKLLKTKSIFDPNVRTYHLAMPASISLFNNKFRGNVLSIINKMRSKNKEKKPCFIDFKKVDTLMPDGTIHFFHQLDKYSNLSLTGRASNSNIVKGMLSKLGIHQRMKLPSFEYKHLYVDRWYTMTGVTADFGDEFVEIQDALQEVLKNEDSEFIVSTAISEAVSNVVHHGYDEHDKYKKWVLFVGISNERCDIIISDLGKTIPKTAPKTLGERFQEAINFKWIEKSDADRIEFAASWRQSSTNDSHRGKGFDNIIQVKEVRDNTIVHILSRKGAWSTTSGKKSYSEAVDGTIVYWSIPIKSSLSALV
ncbi:hypothetical protein M5F03_02535 [Acinetobacter sp. ANC 5579]|uniref:ATP-binding protein n=1 Tax=Acinetobacter amyesii TaxID=2942470 RepID=UPI0020C13E23|nr:hypothetical protein [Acinetobacter amyesii]MCL6234055.1 hypothetical protein [Acinetobacter amyesii]